MFELFNMYQEAVYSICRAIIIRVIQDQVVELLVLDSFPSTVSTYWGLPQIIGYNFIKLRPTEGLLAMYIYVCTVSLWALNTL